MGKILEMTAKISIYELRLLVEVKFIWFTISGRPLRDSMLFIVKALKLCCSLNSFLMFTLCYLRIKYDFLHTGKMFSGLTFSSKSETDCIESCT